MARAEVQPKGNKNAFKHGRYTAEAVASRREVAALIRAMRAFACPRWEVEGALNLGRGSPQHLRLTRPRNSESETGSPASHARESLASPAPGRHRPAGQRGSSQVRGPRTRIGDVRNPPANHDKIVRVFGRFSELGSRLNQGSRSGSPNRITYNCNPEASARWPCDGAPGRIDPGRQPARDQRGLTETG
jgi:hypothetical protein